MYRSFLGPLDLYCSDDDEVLTEEEVWRVYGLTTPVHDSHDPSDRRGHGTRPMIPDMLYGVSVSAS
jgi:hypothetical protein